MKRHLFEHVMFTGSGHVPYGMHDKLTEGVGGSNNGTTSNDRTTYFETVPSNYLESVLWLEADRMGFLLETLDIAKLNAAWDAAHASWDALLESREAPDQVKAREDLTAFYTRVAETYFRTVREAIKAVAPNQLYLGCRFAWVNDRAAKAAAEFCDVVSYNLYRHSVADFQYPGGDKPLIIGEFHFGALDRGMFHTGLVPVENQAARAEA